MHATCSQDTVENSTWITENKPTPCTQASFSRHGGQRAAEAVTSSLEWLQGAGLATSEKVSPVQFLNSAQTLADSVHGTIGRHQQEQCACGQPCPSLFYGHSWCLALLSDPEEQKVAAQPVTVLGTPMGSIQGIVTGSSPLLFCGTLNKKGELPVQHSPQLFIL